MIKNYLKIALRNLIKNRTYAFINVLGLTISTLVVLISATYIVQENSYDNFHIDTENKYRLIRDDANGTSTGTSFPGLFYSMFMQIPEISSVERIISYPENSFNFQNNPFIGSMLFVDSSFFNFFNFPLESGTISSLFNGESVFISESMANRVFGDKKPLNETLVYDNHLNIKIAGVLKDAPINSHLTFDFIAPDYLLKKINPYSLSSDGAWHANYYFEIKEKFKLQSVLEKITKVFISNYGEEYVEALTFKLQPFKEIYLHSASFEPEYIKRGNITHVAFIGVVGILILIISCFNYINISLALLNKRIKEITLRKIVGASRRQLITQFYFEALIISFLAVWIGVVLSELSLPYLNRSLSMELQVNYNYLIGIVFTLLVGLPFVISTYPALLFTAHSPIQMLKKKEAITFKQNKKGFLKLNQRQFLLVAQFSIATLMIAATIIIYNQMDFVINDKLGYNKTNRIVFENPYTNTMYKRFLSIKHECSSNPDIKNISAAFSVPADGINNASAIHCLEPGHERTSIPINSVDYNYFKTIGAKIIEGRDFSSLVASDSTSAIILSKKAIKELNIPKPYLGKKFRGFYDTVNIYTLIGVVEDIFYWSKKEETAPVAYFVRPSDYPHNTRRIIVEFTQNKYNETLEFLKNLMQKLAPEYPFNYSDLETKTAAQYEPENQMFSMLKILSSLSLFLVTLGLTGVILLNIEKRKKEIGIRKVLGANQSGILILIMNNFLILVSIGFIIGCPIAFRVMQNWLNEFAYSIGISFWHFSITAFLLYFLASVLIIIETFKTIRTNPVEVLKYE